MSGHGTASISSPRGHKTEFKVGEDVRVMVYSITEGEEKPLKYPLMFRSADLVLVNKVDLLEHLDFDLEQFLGNLDAVNRGVEYILYLRAPARVGAWRSGAPGWSGASPPESRPPGFLPARGLLVRPVSGHGSSL
jgi:hydrogenase nickel incorporation protein HypB